MTDDNLFDGTEDTNPTPQKRRLRDRWLMLSIVGLVTVALVGIAGVTMFFGKSTADALDLIQRDSKMMPMGTDRPEPAPGDGSTSPLDFALMVTQGDTPAQPGDADVVKLMLMHIPADRETAYLVSLPSDYWVDIPGHGTDNIVEAYPAGGPALTVQTVEQLLNVRVDHTALVKMEGMMDVIDTLGGVTVTNKHATSSNGFSYPEGPVELTGKSAANFVQERDGLPNAEADRAERQQDVLSAVAGKLISRDVLTNPTMFGDAVKILGPNMTVDSELDNSTLVGIGSSMRVTGGDDVKAVMAPEASAHPDSKQQSRVEVDEAKLAELKDALRDDTMAEYVEANNS